MTTPHTCGGPRYGRKTPGCPRCDELLAGAAPVAWGTRQPAAAAPSAHAYVVHFGPLGYLVGPEGAVAVYRHLNEARDAVNALGGRVVPFHPERFVGTLVKYV